MNIEIMSLSQQEARFVKIPEIIVPSGADPSILEFVTLHREAMADPSGITYIHGRSSVERRIRYFGQGGFQLRVVWAVAADAGVDLFADPATLQANPHSAYRQLGVIEPDGSMMAIGLEERQLPHARLGDPFARLIMGYFKDQFRSR